MEAMVQLGEELPFSENSPQFFKIYLPHQSSQAVRIPPAFLKYFNGVLPYKSTITNMEGRSWKVESNKVNGSLYFQDGWHQFVLDNFLEFGDILIFYYGGNAKFYVKIYGTTGCLKKLNPATSDIHKTNSLPQEDRIAENRKSKRLSCVVTSDEVADNNLCSGIPTRLHKKSRALKEADNFTSKFPFFKIFMSSYYVNRGPVNVPGRFVSRFMPQDIQSATLVGSTKSWSVGLSRNSDRKNVCAFTNGWRIFSSQNTLKVGDVCVFELVKREGFELKVSVFRCLD